MNQTPRTTPAREYYQVATGIGLLGWIGLQWAGTFSYVMVRDGVRHLLKG